MNDIIVSKENTKIKIKFWYLFLFNFLFILLCYFPNLQMRFSTDSYNQIWHMNATLQSGRFVSYLSELVQRLFSHPVLNQQFYFFVFIFFISLCISFLIKIYQKVNDIDSIKKLIFIDLVFVFSFTNVLMQEYFCFPEMYLQYGIGLLFMVFSACNFFTNKNYACKILFSSLLLILSLNSYQIFIQPWLIFTVTFVLIKYKNKLCKNLCKEVFCIFVILILSALATIFIMKVMQFMNIASTARGITTSNFISNMNQIIQNIKQCFVNPIESITGIVIYIIVCILILEYIYLMKKLLNKQIDLFEFFIPILFALFGFCVTFGMHVFMSDIWLVPRVLIGLGFAVSSLLLIFAVESETYLEIFSICTFLLFIVNIYYLQSISINQYANNRLDQEYVSNVYNRIDEYEKNNKIEIKNISFCKGKYPSWGYYKNIKYIFGDVNIREFMVDWGQVEIINYYSHRNFKKIKMPEDIYKKYFANKNWNYYKPEEQLVFIGETLYIFVY